MGLVSESYCHLKKLTLVAVLYYCTLFYFHVKQHGA